MYSALDMVTTCCHRKILEGKLISFLLVVVTIILDVLTHIYTLTLKLPQINVKSYQTQLVKDQVHG